MHRWFGKIVWRSRLAVRREYSGEPTTARRYSRNTRTSTISRWIDSPSWYQQRGPAATSSVRCSCVVVTSRSTANGTTSVLARRHRDHRVRL